MVIRPTGKPAHREAHQHVKLKFTRHVLFATLFVAWFHFTRIKVEDDGPFPAPLLPNQGCENAWPQVPSMTALDIEGCALGREGALESIGIKGHVILRLG